MMWRILTATVLVAGLAAVAEAEETGPVVVELYTSQGCSSCPPADALLLELARRDDVIPLALHVDYWDYIGWKDSFGDPAFSKRQKEYARAAGHRSVYTPQMIVEGVDHVIGNRPMRLAQVISDRKAEGSPVSLSMVRQGGSVVVSASAETALDGDLVVQLVRYLPEQTVSIGRGENAGRSITYANIVTDWNPVATWDGNAPFSRSFEVADDASLVVIIQERGPGRILAAARLR